MVNGLEADVYKRQAVRREYQKWLEEHKNKPYVIHEAAILFESGFYKMMDFTILVTADKEQRICLLYTSRCV